MANERRPILNKYYFHFQELDLFRLATSWLIFFGGVPLLETVRFCRNLTSLSLLLLDLVNDSFLIILQIVFLQFIFLAKYLFWVRWSHSICQWWQLHSSYMKCSWIHGLLSSVSRIFLRDDGCQDLVHDFFDQDQWFYLLEVWFIQHYHWVIFKACIFWFIFITIVIWSLTKLLLLHFFLSPCLLFLISGIFIDERVFHFMMLVHWLFCLLVLLLSRFEMILWLVLLALFSVRSWLLTYHL